MSILVHEVWIDSERMPGLCLVEALGDDFRELQEVGAQIVATIEASSHFEAMSKYNAMLGEGPYTTAFELGRKAYPRSGALLGSVLDVANRGG